MSFEGQGKKGQDKAQRRSTVKQPSQEYAPVHSKKAMSLLKRSPGETTKTMTIASGEIAQKNKTAVQWATEASGGGRVSCKNEQKLTQKIDPYDTHSNITLAVKASLSTIRLPSMCAFTLPVAITIKAQDLSLDQLAFRPALDLVCLIDVSGSMKGRKFELVKRTILGLQRFLNRRDRICLIKFNHSPKSTGLVESNPENWEILESKIQKVKASGGTDIAEALSLAFKVLQKRLVANPVTSIFLLTDGKDEQPVLSSNFIKNELSKLTGINFTINTFGFGDDHDASLLRSISALKDGEFHYVDRLEVVDEYFAVSLGGMMSTIAEEIQIVAKTTDEGPLAGITISKAFGDSWKRINPVKSTATLTHLLAGSERGFVLELMIPPMDFRLESTLECIALRVKVVGRSPTDGGTFKLTKSLVLTLTSSEFHSESHVADLDVSRNYFRVRTAETIENALYLNNQENYQEAITNINRLIAEIRQMPTEEGFEGLLQSLRQSLEHCERRGFDKNGDKQLIEHAYNYYRQQPHFIGAMVIQQTWRYKGLSTMCETTSCDGANVLSYVFNSGYLTNLSTSSYLEVAHKQCSALIQSRPVKRHGYWLSPTELRSFLQQIEDQFRFSHEEALYHIKASTTDNISPLLPLNNIPR